ncbi:MAG: hypothetical protein HY317_05340 [Acidobacteria bacterium]|nr:hypothetical protein [Acidobacteriota bacterium]
MGRLLTTRRSQWIPAVAASAVLVGIGAALGLSAGPRLLTFYVGVLVGALVVTGLLRMRLRHRERAESARRHPQLELLRGGKHYDLADDDSTDDQQWLM